MHTDVCSATELCLGQREMMFIESVGTEKTINERFKSGLSAFKTVYVYAVPLCVQMSVVPLNYGLHTHTHSNVPFIHQNLCLSTTPTMMPLIKHLLSITFPQTIGHCKTQSPQEYTPNSPLKNSPTLMTTLVC